MNRLAQRVASGSGDRRDDGALFARETVEQTRLPDVGSPGEHGVHSATQQASLAAPREQLFKSAAHAYQPLSGGVAVQLVKLLFWEVELRFGQRAQFDQRLAKRCNCRRELPAERAQRAAGRFAACGVDEISHGFSLGEVEPAFEKGAAREFARVGKPRAGVKTGSE